MKGIIIAGGFGTRLRPLTYNRPKHLLPVANRPFLEYQVAILKRHGIRDIIFATNYHADQIEAHFGDGSRFGVRMRYALEGEPLGTAGAIRNAASLADGDSVLVFNGDILTDFDLTEIIEFHRAREAEATIALRAVERPHPFGIVLADPDGRVRAWHEPSQEEKKRASENPGPPTGEMDFINAGIYVIEPHVVAGIPAGRSVSIERETYPALLEAGAHIYGCGPLGFWQRNPICKPLSQVFPCLTVLGFAHIRDVKLVQVVARIVGDHPFLIDIGDDVARLDARLLCRTARNRRDDREPSLVDLPLLLLHHCERGPDPGKGAVELVIELFLLSGIEETRLGIVQSGEHQPQRAETQLLVIIHLIHVFALHVRVDVLERAGRRGVIALPDPA